MSIILPTIFKLWRENKGSIFWHEHKTSRTHENKIKSRWSWLEWQNLRTTFIIFGKFCEKIIHERYNLKTNKTFPKMYEKHKRTYFRLKTKIKSQRQTRTSKWRPWHSDIVLSKLRQLLRGWVPKWRPRIPRDRRRTRDGRTWWGPRRSPSRMDVWSGQRRLT